MHYLHTTSILWCNNSRDIIILSGEAHKICNRKYNNFNYVICFPTVHLACISLLIYMLVIKIHVHVQNIIGGFVANVYDNNTLVSLAWRWHANQPLTWSNFLHHEPFRRPIINTLKSQSCLYFAENKCIFPNWSYFVVIQIALKFALESLVANNGQIVIYDVASLGHNVLIH